MGKHTHQVAATAVNAQSRVAVSAVLVACGNGNGRTPVLAAVGTAPAHYVDIAGEVAFRIAPSVGHGHNSTVATYGQSGYAVELRH